MSTAVIAKIEWGRVVHALQNDDRLLLAQPTVARLIDIAPRTLRRWRDLGDFPPPDKTLFNSKGEAYWVGWKRETLLCWIEQQPGR